MGLIDFLAEYKDSRLPMHMPGHKRNAGLAGYLERLAADLDVTEAAGLDNLHHPTGILKAGMERTAALWGSDRAYWLVNSASGGILAGVWAAVPDGGRVICARNCHKSVANALLLRRARTAYLLPETGGRGIAGPISPEAVDKALSCHPDASLVVVTSPTYEGVASDIPGICAAAHARGVPVLVDEAHGAHFGFGHGFPDGAVRAGADLVVHSLHKTLPSLTQTAVLHLKGDRVDPRAVGAALGMFETSSPSYLLMASIDGCTGLLRARGDDLFRAWQARLNALRRQLSGLARLALMEGGPNIDPSKIVVCTDGADICGPGLAQALRARGIEPEMAAPQYVTLMTGMGDTDETMALVGEALLSIDRALSPGKSPPRPAPVLPARALYPWEVAGLASEEVPPEDGLGRVCAEPLWAYPPGIPLVLPGEVLSAEVLQTIMALCAPGRIRVLGFSTTNLDKSGGK